MTAETDFIDRLRAVAPEIEPALQEHLRDQEGELLPYVFSFEIAKWLDASASADTARAATVLAWLEDEFARGEFAVRNLIDVGIIEMLPSVPEGRPVLDLLPPGLKALAEDGGLFLPREP
ncbi:DUF7674 family protein [Nocardioides okcheonensis]|uniref:DUF7674 family protein n=1 Tax=Nocardioides okcheonensis TaxID=2894081 RepID=UPI001E5676DB|nr:hypothetical protein [Nocardioides okcheonensis]UFN46400.1 hypothetical protein LN652_09420 [Nocardioides okcheonensis]